MKYFSLVNSITHAGKRYIGLSEIINSNEKPTINLDSTIFTTYDGIKIDITKAKSKIYYDVYIEYDFEYPTYMTKMCNIISIEHNIYLNSFPTICRAVKES